MSLGVAPRDTTDGGNLAACFAATAGPSSYSTPSVLVPDWSEETENVSETSESSESSESSINTISESSSLMVAVASWKASWNSGAGMGATWSNVLQNSSWRTCGATSSESGRLVKRGQPRMAFLNSGSVILWAGSWVKILPRIWFSSSEMGRMVFRNSGLYVKAR